MLRCQISFVVVVAGCCSKCNVSFKQSYWYHRPTTTSPLARSLCFLQRETPHKQITTREVQKDASSAVHNLSNCAITHQAVNSSSSNASKHANNKMDRFSRPRLIGR
eukprot:GHVS01005899.1.p1 GENE.GHVS01005899.1~~GHVS01005899.1.p1  ORF type:complete len:107 (-),score=15.96 GHVS01005899.1:278-598(-)